MNRIILLAAIVSLSGVVLAGDYSAKSGSFTDVDACYNDRTQCNGTGFPSGKMVNGDILRVPATATFADWGTNNLSITSNIWMIGAGVDRTTIQGGPNIITLNTTYVNPPGTPPAEVRLSGMTIHLTTSHTLPYGMVIVKGYSQNIRIDHIKWQGSVFPPGSSGPSIGGKLWFPSGWTYGVIDHCVGDDTNSFYPNFMMGNGGWPASSGNPGNPTASPTPPKNSDGVAVTREAGDFSWTETGQSFWGTAKNWYVEDCVWLTVGGFIGSYEPGGARVVARHISGKGRHAMHGTDTTGGTRSFRAQDNNNNWFDSSSAIATIEWRGSSGNAFNNRITKPGFPNAALSLYAYRASANYGVGIYNSADGCGQFDTNDRTGNSPVTGSPVTNPCTGGTRGDGSDATNKPCLPTDGRSGAIFAAGTAAAGGASGAGVTLPGLSSPAANCWRGYVVRDADLASPLDSCGSTRHWAVIAEHSSGATTLARADSVACKSPFPPVDFPSGKWEIRHVLHALDEPGSGAGGLVVGPANKPVPPSIGMNQANELNFQWSNQGRTSVNVAWDTPGTRMDSTEGSNTLDYWGMGPGQNFTYDTQSDRALKNGIRTIAHGASSNYPEIDLTGFSNAKKDAYLRIGADDEAIALAGLTPHTYQINAHSGGTPDPGAATRAWGYIYPHPLVATSPAISSLVSASFSVGQAGTFTVVTSGFSNGVPTLAKSGSLPTGVTFTDNADGTATIAGTPAAGTDASSPYTISITATGTGGQSATQNPFTLTVTAVNTAPHDVVITSPSNGSFWLTSNTITITATALDDEGPLANAKFYSDNVLIGTVTTASPFVFNWSTPPAGTHILKVTATDQGNLSGTSPTVSITVTTGPTPTPTPSPIPTPPTIIALNIVPPVSPTPTPSITPPPPPTPTPTPTPSPPAITSAASTSFLAGGVVDCVNNTNCFTVTTANFVGQPALTETGTLPSNVTFIDNTDGTARLSGAATGATAQAYPLTIAADAAGSQHASQSFTLTVTATPTPTPTAATPTFNPVAGAYVANSSGVKPVTVADATTAAAIRYTIDGSAPSTTIGTLINPPNTSSTPSGTANLSVGTTTLKAIGFKTGSNNSAVQSGVYTVNPSPTPTPTATPTSPAGRLATDNDGNMHDRDDINSIGWELALIAAAGRTSDLVYVGYNNHYWQTSGSGTSGQQKDMTDSTTQAASDWGIPSGVLHNNMTDLTGSINALAAEIAASTSSNKLTIMAAGPMQVTGRALAQARATNPSALQYVTILSHSTWNNTHAAAAQGEGLTDTPRYSFSDFGNSGLALGAKPVQLALEGRLDAATYASFSWAQNAADVRLQHLYQRGVVAGKQFFDCSDSGMTYYILIGVNNPFPIDYKNFFATRGIQ